MAGRRGEEDLWTHSSRLGSGSGSGGLTQFGNDQRQSMRDRSVVELSTGLRWVVLDCAVVNDWVCCSFLRLHSHACVRSAQVVIVHEFIN